MNYFTITSLLVFITTISMGVVTLLKGKSNKAGSSFTLFAFSCAIWGFCGFEISLTRLESQSLFWWQIAYISVALSPVFFYQLICDVLGLKDRIYKIILYGFYVLAGISLLLNFFQRDNFLGSLSYVFDQFYYIDWFKKKSIPYLVIYLILHWVLLFYSFYLLVKEFIPASGIKRNQLKYFMLSCIVGWVGAEGLFLPAFRINIYPYSNIFVVIYPLIIAYAIFRHQLLDIEVVIKKSLVFAGMFTFVFGVVVAVAMLVAQLLGGTNNLLSLAISALVITFTMRPIETWLVNATDKFLFQKRYEYKQILKAFIDEVITVLNLDEVINSTLKLLDQTLHPYNASIFILNKVEDKYQLYNSIGIEDKNIVFTSDSKLITYLKKTHNAAVLRQIDGIAGVSPDIQQELAKLKSIICLPLLLHDDLIGFISLGKKKSDEEYTKDDLDVLLDLSRTESIAVGNAQLLTEAAQAERRAAIGTMAAGINHEIGNPLNIINTKIQVFLVGIQRGLYNDKPKEEVVQECTSILNETIKQTNRIAEITRKLSNFAKPSKEFKPQLINILDEIEETLSMVGHELEMEKIKIEKEFSSTLPKMLADKQEMQQILFNLIRNAGQAIEGEGKIIIRALSTNEDKLHIEIQDTGKGIPEDKINRIFEPFFTTKGPNKGTGLGLSIVRQLVWKNKGEISFRSQVGVGTTFILEFPGVRS